MARNPQLTAKIGGDAEGLQRTLGKVEGRFKGFAKKIGATMKKAAIVGMAGVAAGVGAALKNGFDQKIVLEQNEALMKSLMGGAEKARDAMKMLAAEANENPIFSKTAMTQAGATLATVVQGNTVRLQSMLETAQKLSTLNMGEGITGAAEALQKAMSGDYGDLSEAFKIPQSTVDALQKAGFQGQALVEQALKIQGINDQTVKDQGNTTSGRMAQLRSKWDDFSLKLMDGIWPKLQDLLTKIMDTLTKHMPEILTAAKMATDKLIALVEMIGPLLEKFDTGTQAVSDAWYSDKNVLRKAQDNMAAGADFWRNVFGGMNPIDAYKQAEGQVKGAQLGARGKELESRVVKLRVDASGYNGVPKMMGAT